VDESLLDTDDSFLDVDDSFLGVGQSFFTRHAVAEGGAVVPGRGRFVHRRGRFVPPLDTQMIRRTARMIRGAADEFSGVARARSGNDRSPAHTSISLSRRDKLETLQGIMLEKLRAVQLFLEKYITRLVNVGNSGSRRQLDQAVADLENLAESQATSENTTSRAPKARELRHDLIEKHMLPILRLASVNLPRTPELAKLAIPKGTPTPERLVLAAKVMGQVVTPFAQTFIDAGLPPTFLEELDAAANAVANFAADRKRSIGVGKAATEGIRATLSRAGRVITALEALIRKDLDSRNPADKIIRDEWNSVSKARKTGVRSAAAEPVPIPPAAQAEPAAIPAPAPASAQPATTSSGGAS
jgi:hypothetical protein